MRSRSITPRCWRTRARAGNGPRRTRGGAGRSVELGAHGPGRVQVAGAAARRPATASSSTAAASKRPLAASIAGSWRRSPPCAGHQDPQALRPQAAGPVAPGDERPLQVGEHAGDDRRGADRLEEAVLERALTPWSAVNSVARSRPGRAGAAVERVDEEVGVVAPPARGSGPACPPRRGRAPRRRPTSMSTTRQGDRDAATALEHRVEQRVAAGCRSRRVAGEPEVVEQVRGHGVERAVGAARGDLVEPRAPAWSTSRSRRACAAMSRAATSSGTARPGRAPARRTGL